MFGQTTNFYFLRRPMTFNIHDHYIDTGSDLLYQLVMSKESCLGVVGEWQLPVSAPANKCCHNVIMPICKNKIINIINYNVIIVNSK